MILLDTNVFSEPLKPRPNPSVEDWIARQPDGSLCISAVSVAEVLAGIALMPAGRRRAILNLGFESILRSAFQDRVLVFDEAAARRYADIFATMRAAGRGITQLDCQIAAIAAAHGFAVATRDTQPFIDAGVEVVNPWAEE